MQKIPVRDLDIGDVIDLTTCISPVRASDPVGARPMVTAKFSELGGKEIFVQVTGGVMVGFDPDDQVAVIGHREHSGAPTVLAVLEELARESQLTEQARRNWDIQAVAAEILRELAVALTSEGLRDDGDEGRRRRSLMRVALLAIADVAYADDLKRSILEVLQTEPRDRCGVLSSRGWPCTLEQDHLGGAHSWQLEDGPDI
jgi:hypothetical protein